MEFDNVATEEKTSMLTRNVIIVIFGFVGRIKKKTIQKKIKQNTKQNKQLHDYYWVPNFVLNIINKEHDYFSYKGNWEEI